MERVKNFQIKLKKKKCHSTLCSSMECAIQDVSGNTDMGHQLHP